VIVHEDGPELREIVATACRVLAARGLVEGVLGHVSARVAPDELVIRCRGPNERGLGKTRAEEIRRVTLDGVPVDLPDGYSAPKELPLHAELLRARPELGAVVHAHPRSALLCGLAELEPRAVFGAYNIPAARMAQEGIPVFPRPVLISRSDLARELVDAMGGSDVCILRGHGVAVGGRSVQEATVTTVDLDTLLAVTVQLATLGAAPPELTRGDRQELPDLGSAFHTELGWRALVADLP